LTVVLDLADSKVIGWALSQTMKAKHTTVAALRMAIRNRPVARELIFHSDRGVHLTEGCSTPVTSSEGSLGLIP